MPLGHALLLHSELISAAAAEGRVFYASDADQNDLILGQTSFVNTTPTLLVQTAADSGYTIVPIYLQLGQTGTVAGGAIDVIMEIDNVARYASGGVAETVLGARTDGAGPYAGALPTGVAVYSNPTADAGYGVRIYGITIGQDVSPAEGAPNDVIWTPSSCLDFLRPTASIGASWLIYTYAATTGPTWFWTMKFAVLPNSWLP